MNRVRPPCVAGTFYPESPTKLRLAVESYITTAPAASSVPKALIVPHAGYIYSGPVAGKAFSLMAPARETVRRVVLVGPSHRTPFSGLASSGATAFRTPLGEAPIDAEGAAAALRLPQVSVLDEAHAGEHSLEVQLPFLQVALARFSIVPLLTGHTEADEVAEVLEVLWGGPETMIVISTDLSHYLTYEEASIVDARTAAAIETLHPENTGARDACGADGVRGLLVVAKRRGLAVRRVDLRTSGDTAGPKDRVVGYGAFAVYA